MLVRRIARPMLASTFVFGGISSLRAPEPRAEAAEKIGVPDTALTRALHITSSEQAVKVNAGIHIAAGLMLATNRFPRLAALALAATLVPTTAAGHRFWEEEDKTKRANQQAHFFKNASLFGGLLIAAVDTEGRDSTVRRARRAARLAARESRRAAKSARSQAVTLTAAAPWS
jgi:putative oxidoreductase